MNLKVLVKQVKLLVYWLL